MFWFEVDGGFDLDVRSNDGGQATQTEWRRRKTVVYKILLGGTVCNGVALENLNSVQCVPWILSQ